MTSGCRLALISLVFTGGVWAQNNFDGRWDLTVHTAAGTYPSWIEVTSSSTGSRVRMVGRTGSVQPATNVSLQQGNLSFLFGETKLELELRGEALTGTETDKDGKVEKVIGVRAPKLNHPEPASWKSPEPLFNSRNLDGWQPDNPATNHWVVQDGVLLNESKGANLRTSRRFSDFKLHIEVNCPKDRNSGIYLRGRYETQIEYDPHPEDALHRMGSIYGFLGSDREVGSRAGQWETFDITLVGRTVTIVRDGITTIDHKEIPGITGGAIDSEEGQPGPIYLQGDHSGGMQYRNITIAVPKT